MAKRKKTAKRRTTRRRSVSGLVPSKDTLMQVVGVIAGLAVAGKGSGYIPVSDGRAKAAIILAGGALLAVNKNNIIRSAGLGIAALGGYQLVNALKAGTLPAISGTPSFRLDQVSGFNSYPNNPQRNVIAGFNSYPNNPQMNVIAGVSRPWRAAVSGL